MIRGRKVSVVSPGDLLENNIAVGYGSVDRFSSQGETLVFVLSDGELIGACACLYNTTWIKKGHFNTKKIGYKDHDDYRWHKKVAGWVAQEIGFDEYFAEVLPWEKSDKVAEVQSRDITVAITGDGVTDAPAPAMADVGIAIGAVIIMGPAIGAVFMSLSTIVVAINSRFLYVEK